MIYKYFVFSSGQNARALNDEQKTAVVNIAACSNGKIPYILDGPPGLFFNIIIFKHKKF